jgi:hypothetical protein
MLVLCMYDRICGRSFDYASQNCPSELFFAILGVVNRHFFNNYLSFDRTTASNGIKFRRTILGSIIKTSTIVALKYYTR